MGDWKQARLVRAAEVRLVIEQIIGGLQGSFAAAAVAAAFASGVAAAAAAEAAQESQTGSSSSSSLTRANSMSISQQFRVDVLRENTEAVCATCDAAHGRWAKLLGVRALIHPKLRLQEFVGIYEITQEFISATEKVGGRLGYSIRGTLQSQSKSFVDYQHTLRVCLLSLLYGSGLSFL
jgi:vacuolar protein sorting-associated protein 54